MNPYTLSLLFLSCFVFINPSIIHANDVRVREKAFLGEYDPGLFAGTHAPFFTRSKLSGGANFLDYDFLQRRYLNNIFFNDLAPLVDFTTIELPSVTECPDTYLEKNLDYMRYLYRLITLSYLFETLKESNKELFLHSESEGSCDLNIKELVKECSPQSADMKRFLSRIRTIDDYKFKVYKFSPLTKREKANYKLDPFFVNEFNRLSLSIPTHFNDTHTLSKNLSTLCNETRSRFQHICSERDLLYGISKTPLPTMLIGTSHVLKVLNEGGMGLGCLKRYAALHRPLESNPPFFSKSFLTLYKKLVKNQSVYEQGDLFLPGALKEFDDLGLNDFLFTEPEPPAPVVAIVEEAPKKTPPPVFEVPIVEKPLPTKVVVAKPIAPPPPVITYSAFELAEQQLRNGAVAAPLDMKRLKEDFLITKELIAKIDEPLKEFQTRQGLLDMRNFDKLGTKAVPFRLLFLKYLIENNYHQGLFNIQQVMGGPFYLQNDIGKVKSVALAELQNDLKTRFKWQIVLLKE